MDEGGQKRTVVTNLRFGEDEHGSASMSDCTEHLESTLLFDNFVKALESSKGDNSEQYIALSELPRETKIRITNTGTGIRVEGINFPEQVATGHRDEPTEGYTREYNVGLKVIAHPEAPDEMEEPCDGITPDAVDYECIPSIDNCDMCIYAEQGLAASTYPYQRDAAEVSYDSSNGFTLTFYQITGSGYDDYYGKKLELGQGLRFAADNNDDTVILEVMKNV